MTDARRDLFCCKRVYDMADTSGIFMQAMREAITAHCRHPFYREWINMHGFSPEMLQTEADLANIPPLPAAFFKLHAIEAEQKHLTATSSGTQGQKSRVDFDKRSYDDGVLMAINVMKYFGLISPIPSRYVMLGFEPHDGAALGATMTAMGVSRLTPAISRVFALRYTGKEHLPDVFGILDALRRYEKQPFPVRFVGFPSYLYTICAALNEAGIRLNMPKGSIAMLGGGWKGRAGDAISQAELRELAEETLGLPHQRVRDFYSALEHPVAYAECEGHHLHVPIHSRAIVRDAATLAPLPFGKEGLLSFVSPLVLSMPLASVLMNDIAVLRPGSDCGCGIETPYFEVLGRAGRVTSRNCAASAAELLG